MTPDDLALMRLAHSLAGKIAQVDLPAGRTLAARIADILGWRTEDEQSARMRGLGDELLELGLDFRSRAAQLRGGSDGWLFEKEGKDWLLTVTRTVVVIQPSSR